MIRKFWILALVASMAACGSKKEVDPAGFAGGLVGAINATSDSPALNFRGNNQLQRSTYDSTLPFGTGSGLVAKGVGDVLLSVAYARPGAEGVFLIEDFEFLLGLDDEWTFISTGSIAVPQLIAIRNDPIVVTELVAEVQFVNASSNLPTAEFHLTDIDDALGVPDATVAAGQYTDLLTVGFFADARLRVREPGSDVVLWDSGRFIVPTGTRTQFILIDYFGPSGNGVRVLGAGAGAVSPFGNEDLPSQVRVVNFIDDVAAIDIYFGDVSGAPDYAAASFAEVGD
ncbi:MAG: hypothetical protein O7H39_10410, partial [Gammaproteobacteria bacterium]|nr:hypothetical protein [Gammaproteobacteria bacterium]